MSTESTAPLPSMPGVAPSEVEADALERERLEQTWASKKGLIAWLSEVHHVAIGRRIIITASDVRTSPSFSIASRKRSLLSADHAVRWASSTSLMREREELWAETGNACWIGLAGT